MTHRRSYIVFLSSILTDLMESSLGRVGSNRMGEVPTLEWYMYRRRREVGVSRCGDGLAGDDHGGGWFYAITFVVLV